MSSGPEVVKPGRTGKAGKKRSRKEADAPVAKLDPAVATKPRKKRRTKTTNQQLTPDELERRRVQRELRELALKLRAEGKTYKPQKYKRKLFTAEGAGKARRERKKEKTQRQNKVWVVVLPIFWEQRLQEMEAVLGAAKKVEGLLAELGVRVVVDDNNDYKPGERMKHWEELGVPIRVEIGPQDVQNGSCVVAVAGEPGSVAKKSTAKMSGALVRKVQQLLKDAGAVSQAKGQEAAETQGDGEEEEEVDEEAGPSGEEEEEEEAEEEGRRGQVEAGAAGSSGGGDDMDDFELEVDAEEDALTLNKKEAAIKKRRAERARQREEKKREKAAKRGRVKAAAGKGGEGEGEEGGEGAGPSWEDTEAKKKASKKGKLVVFK